MRLKLAALPAALVETRSAAQYQSVAQSHSELRRGSIHDPVLARSVLIPVCMYVVAGVLAIQLYGACQEKLVCLKFDGRMYSSTSYVSWHRKSLDV
jgi:hypothetical protein